ncbi:MAG TPA: DUF6519 domain-containing protein [Longimicrobiaceae bacterium]
MNGDFSRDTFDRRYRFSRVLLQQGRVLLDADWNEQTSILLHYIRSLAKDLIGPHGGPPGGFELLCDPSGEQLRCDFGIGYGHYYVDGILCENEPPLRCGAEETPPPLRYSNQPYLPLDEDEKELDQGADYFVYLDVWERHLTHIEAGHIREVALGGPDTATRAQVVWQVKVLNGDCCENHDDYTCADWMAQVVKDYRRCLRARARVPEPSDDPCIIPPEARYRGAENQLYRVEIHDGGEAGSKGATWKWSRDNGSVVFAIRELQGSTATLETLGPDDRRTLVEGDWVEIVDDRSVLRGRPGVLARVDAVDRVKYQVTLSVAEGTALPVFTREATTHPLLRRWDQGSAALPVQEGKWIDLEDGVQVYFDPGGTYRTADYWLIPARTATGDVLWPTEPDADGTPSPVALPPHGIEHHYAPLGRIAVDDDGIVTCLSSCRCVLTPPCAEVAEPPEEPPPNGEPGPDVPGPDQPTPPTPAPTPPTPPTPTPTPTPVPTPTPIPTPTPTPIPTPTPVPTPTPIPTPTPGPTPPTPISGGVVGSLLDLRHVGESRAELLRRAGHGTIEDVARMPAEEIARVLRVSPRVAEEVLESARAAVRR